MILGLLVAAIRCEAERPVYGIDDRKDYFEVTDARLRRSARSVPALFRAADVEINGKGARLKTEPFLRGDAGGVPLPLRSDVRFRGQPDGARCSAVLAAPDIVVTAGHCLRSLACKDMAVVFDFSISYGGEDATIVPKDSVYRCTHVLRRVYDSVDEPEERGLPMNGLVRQDFAIVQLDRRVEDREPLGFNMSGSIEKGAQVAAIGYPLGLPLKVSAGAKVLDSRYKRFFMADLDVSKGSSGGPVLNVKTGLVEGIATMGTAREFVIDMPVIGASRLATAATAVYGPGQLGVGSIATSQFLTDLADAISLGRVTSALDGAAVKR